MKKVLYKASPKMRRVREEVALAKHRILEGAVRSSKTFLANDIAIDEIQQLPPCDVLLSGYSITSVARNVISPWKEIINPSHYDLFRNVKVEKDDYIVIDWRGLRDKKFYVRGAGKENDYKQIQGATFGYWLADEWSRHTESFSDMALSRLSLPFAKSLVTTNPDSPFHYIKKRFLDNEKLFEAQDDGSLLYGKWHFLLEDNPSLTEDYIESLKRMYTGVFYKRFILGLWVAAEGAIYDFFLEEEPYVIPKPPGRALSHIVGVDYGTSNPCTFILFGVNPLLKPCIWAEREYYFDSEKSGRQKTDAEYADDMKSWLSGLSPDEVLVDPSAASFKLELSNRGYIVNDAVNDVVDGIRVQARMLKNGQYAICKDCKNTITEYGGYVWDERAQLRGLDAPFKEHDHTKDAERYVLYTKYGAGAVDLDLLTTM